MSFKVRCKKCDAIIDVNDFTGSDFEITESDKRDMGPDNTHEADKEAYCKKCHNNITINVRISEYPVGCFQDPDVDIKDGNFVTKPILDKCIEDLREKSLGK